MQGAICGKYLANERPHKLALTPREKLGLACCAKDVHRKDGVLVLSRAEVRNKRLE